MRRRLFKITWQGKDYELCKTAVCNLTDRSRTFIDDRLSEGYSMQEAIELNPGDPQFRRTQRKSPKGANWNIDKERLRSQEALRAAHSDIFNQFLGGKPCLK